MNVARIVAALLIAAALAGCATRRGAAPVVDARLKGQPPMRVAPAAPRAAPPARTAAATGTPSDDYYVVQRGDTLYSIALEHGADYREVAQWNGLDDPTKIQVGQQLRVKPPAGSAVQVGTARVVTKLESRPLEARPLPPVPQAAKPAAPVTPKAAAVKEEPKKAAAQEEPKLVVPVTATQFIWPVKGKVIAGFNGPRNKGIDIDAKPGDPVVAAAAGRVTYTGTGIPGMGKLVVIKHENGFITVYAHNSAVFVKEQQTVARGQKIAEIGSTDSDRPKLHFQIRKGAAAVDPLLYLPGS